MLIVTARFLAHKISQRIWASLRPIWQNPRASPSLYYKKRCSLPSCLITNLKRSSAENSWRSKTLAVELSLLLSCAASLSPLSLSRASLSLSLLAVTLSLSLPSHALSLSPSRRRREVVVLTRSQPSQSSFPDPDPDLRLRWSNLNAMCIVCDTDNGWRLVIESKYK
ncbi:hypothetical protein YC2023_096309 [Brassica napus]